MEKSEFEYRELHVTKSTHTHPGRILRKWVIGMQIQLERRQTVHKHESRQVRKIMEDGPIENTHYISIHFYIVLILHLCLCPKKDNFQGL